MKEKKHILIVDDVNTNLKCLGEILKDDYAISMAKSGEKAIGILERIHPDLIIMDVKMPGMDGFETLSKIRTEYKNKDIPVLFLSADADSLSEKKALMFEKSVYLKKPFEPSELVNRASDILNNV